MLESESITVVILAGGLGTRLREETEFRPKTLLPINEIPILSHIIEIYANQGCKDFVICAGYLGKSIHEYFSNEGTKLIECKIDVDENSSVYTFKSPIYSNHVKVRVVNTGLDTLAGGRLFRVREYLTGDTFACTYGDGVGNVDFKELLKYHTKSNRLGTVTAVKPPSRFGILEINEENLVTGFMEKPENFWVSGGFFLFQKEFLNLMHENINLEHTLLPKLALAGDLNAYHHRGFWHPMDTQRDFETLNEIASLEKTPPWFAGITRNTLDD
jgi:glucose-1-phosphate cytidylyltransferase